MLNAAVDADVDTIYAKALLAKIKNGDYDRAASTSDVPTPEPTGS